MAFDYLDLIRNPLFFRSTPFSLPFPGFAAEDEGRTEEPTEHKIRKAREEGKVAKSQEFTSSLVLLLGIVTIGAGGGSIGWIDEGGLLRMGPQSAGADPGPACYGKGGAHPTSTDADLVLGYLDPDFFAGGKMKLDKKDQLFLRRPSDLNDAVHPDLDEIVLKAVSFYPDMRFSDCREFLERLEAYKAEYLRN